MAGAAAAASIASSAASGGVSFDGAWFVLYSLQLLIVIGLLDIDYPPKLEAFLQDFSFTMFTVSEDYNLVQQSIPEADLAEGETDDRSQDYGFDTFYFIIQEYAFYFAILVVILLFFSLWLLSLCPCYSTEKKKTCRKKG